MRTEPSTEKPPSCAQAHLGGVIFVDQPTFDEGAQDTGSHARPHVGKRRRVQSMGKGGMKADARCLFRGIVCIGSRLEDAVDDAAVEVNVLVQAGAEPVDEGDRPDPGIGGAAGAMFALAAFHHGKENAQHRALQGRVRLQKVTQSLGHRQHPLPHRQRRENVIDQMRGSVGHAPGVAGGGTRHGTCRSRRSGNRAGTRRSRRGRSHAQGCCIRDSGGRFARQGPVVLHRSRRWRAPARFRGGSGRCDTNGSG